MEKMLKSMVEKTVNWKRPEHECFRSREDAARQLVQKLGAYRGKKGILVLAIPRGGLAIGHILAKELKAPLDIILTKKIGYPGNPEAAMGAVSMQRYQVKPEAVNSPGYSQEYVKKQVQEIQAALKKRYREYKGKAKPLSVRRKTVILVDDGVATGSTLMAAIDVLRKQEVKKIIVAVPVAPAETADALRRKADEVICLREEPAAEFFAISAYYKDFAQVSDEEAKRLLNSSVKRKG